MEMALDEYIEDLANQKEKFEGTINDLLANRSSSDTEIQSLKTRIQELEKKDMDQSREIKALKGKLTENDLLISESSVRLSAQSEELEKDGVMSAQSEELEEKDRVMSAQSEELEEKDRVMSAQSFRMSCQQDMIVEYAEQLTSQSHEIEDSKQKLAKKDDTILILSMIILSQYTTNGLLTSNLEEQARKFAQVVRDQDHKLTQKSAEAVDMDKRLNAQVQQVSDLNIRLSEASAQLKNLETLTHDQDLEAAAARLRIISQMASSFPHIYSHNLSDNPLVWAEMMEKIIVEDPVELVLKMPSRIGV
jgi:hypothetical protein